tara:strand:- start:89 stop:277 length:189 start_codon:yes stop_codon:yes gene_type:complete
MGIKAQEILGASFSRMNRSEGEEALTWAVGSVTRLVKECERIEGIIAIMSDEIARLKGSGPS